MIKQMETTTMMTNEQTQLLNLLSDCKLNAIKETLLEQYDNPNYYSNLSFEERLIHVIRGYQDYEKNAKFRRLISSSKIKNIFYLKQIFPDSRRGLSKDVYESLCNLTFLQESINCIISGLAGCGKTTLAIAAAVEAMKKGYSALYIRASELESDLSVKDNVSLFNYVKKMKRYDVLIIDDFGLSVMNAEIANKFLEVLEARYGVGSIIITTQVQPADLGKTIARGGWRDAITDRLIRTKDIKIQLTGDSFRQSTSELRGSDPSKVVID